MEEPLGPSNRQLARVPRWLSSPVLAGTLKTNLKTTSTSSAKEKVFQAQATLFAKGLGAQAKVTAKTTTSKTALAKSNLSVKVVLATTAWLKTSPVFLSATSGRASDSGLGGRAVVSSTPLFSSATRKSYFQALV